MTTSADIQLFSPTKRLIPVLIQPIVLVARLKMLTCVYVKRNFKDVDEECDTQ